MSEPDLMSARRPMPPGDEPLGAPCKCLPWIVESLRAEREAISQDLERRHLALLNGLTEQAHGDVESWHRLVIDCPSAVHFKTVRRPNLHSSPVKELDLRSSGQVQESASELDAIPSSAERGNAEKTACISPRDGATSSEKDTSDCFLREVPKFSSSGTKTDTNDCSLRDVAKLTSSGTKTDTNDSFSRDVAGQSSSGMMQDSNDCSSREVAKLTNSTTRYQLRSDSQPSLHQNLLARFVSSNRFEIIFASLIVCNTFCMAVVAQFSGLSLGIQMKYLGYDQNQASQDAIMPHAELAFEILEYVFGIAFTLEVLMKVLGLGLGSFVRSGWNWFDTIIITLWVVETFFRRNVLLISPMFLRLARMGRLLRLVRLVRTLEAFQVLHVIVCSLRASALVLFWSAVMLFMVMLACMLVLNFSLEGYMLDEDQPFDKRQQIFEYFGTCMRGFLSVFELTFGNWTPICRVLHEDVSEWFGIAIIVYRSVIGEALVKVMTGVFLFETFKCASTDDDLMIMQKNKEIKQHLEKMQMLFEAADTSGEGFLTLEEFKDVTRDPKVKLWLSAQNLDMQDAQLVFNLCDDGDAKLSAHELASGFARLKGQARSIDLAALITETKRSGLQIEKLIAKICGEVDTSEDAPKRLSMSSGCSRASRR